MCGRQTGTAEGFLGRMLQLGSNGCIYSLPMPTTIYPSDRETDTHNIIRPFNMSTHFIWARDARLFEKGQPTEMMIMMCVYIQLWRRYFRKRQRERERGRHTLCSEKGQWGNKSSPVDLLRRAVVVVVVVRLRPLASPEDVCWPVTDTMESFFDSSCGG